MYDEDYEKLDANLRLDFLHELSKVLNGIYTRDDLNGFCFGICPAETSAGEYVLVANNIDIMLSMYNLNSPTDSINACLGAFYSELDENNYSSLSIMKIVNDSQQYSYDRIDCNHNFRVIHNRKEKYVYLLNFKELKLYSSYTF